MFQARFLAGSRPRIRRLGGIRRAVGEPSVAGILRGFRSGSGSVPGGSGEHGRWLAGTIMNHDARRAALALPPPSPRPRRAGGSGPRADAAVPAPCSKLRQGTLRSDRRDCTGPTALAMSAIVPGTVLPPPLPRAARTPGAGAERLTTRSKRAHATSFDRDAGDRPAARRCALRRPRPPRSPREPKGAAPPAHPRTRSGRRRCGTARR